MALGHVEGRVNQEGERENGGSGVKVGLVGRRWCGGRWLASGGGRWPASGNAARRKGRRSVVRGGELTVKGRGRERERERERKEVLTK